MDPLKESLPTAPLASIDSFPYRHRVGELMSAPVLIVDGATPLGDALRLLTAQKVSSLLVGPGTKAAELGIFTERDVLRALQAQGPEALLVPLAGIATRPLHTIQSDDFVYRAIGHGKVA
jgi:CBS domain-containing protein